VVSDEPGQTSFSSCSIDIEDKNVRAPPSSHPIVRIRAVSKVFFESLFVSTRIIRAVLYRWALGVRDKRQDTHTLFNKMSNKTEVVLLGFGFFTIRVLSEEAGVTTEGVLKSSRRTSVGFIRRDDEFVPSHAELSALLLDEERSVRTLTSLVRAEHSESFDQEFTWAAVNWLMVSAATEGLSKKIIGPGSRVRLSRPVSRFGLGSLCLCFLGFSFGPGGFSLGLLGAGTRCGSLSLFTRGCGFFCFRRFLFSRLNAASTLSTSSSLRSESGVVLIAALPPPEEAIHPCGGLADCFCYLTLGRTLLLSRGQVFRSGTERGHAGFDGLPCSRQKLGNLRDLAQSEDGQAEMVGDWLLVACYGRHCIVPKFIRSKLVTKRFSKCGQKMRTFGFHSRLSGPKRSA
jgi:hypothetical protein